MRILEIQDVLALLQSEVNQAGNISAWSRKTGVDRTVATKALNGTGPLAKGILKALKLRTAFAADEESRRPTARSVLAVQDVVLLLRSEIKLVGGREAWSGKTGVDRTTVSKVTANKRRLTKTIIKALKLRQVFVADE